jgi:hypothetical protein
MATLRTKKCVSDKMKRDEMNQEATALKKRFFDARTKKAQITTNFTIASIHLLWDNSHFFSPTIIN